jgi:hypothetical protein
MDLRRAKALGYVWWITIITTTITIITTFASESSRPTATTIIIITTTIITIIITTVTITTGEREAGAGARVSRTSLLMGNFRDDWRTIADAGLPISGRAII